MFYILHIRTGIECGDRFDCDKAKKCKYGKINYKLHNLSVDIHRFFEYRFHIKLPYLICFSKKWERLSGTDKCPFHKSRNYGCYDCKYVCGDILRECSCKDRINVPYQERKPHVKVNGWKDRCAYFEKCSFADDWKNN